jgi:hypothetical protein
MKMRKISCLSAIALFAVTSPAMAQNGPVTGTVDIDGSVANRCLFTVDSAVISVGELTLSGGGAAAGRLDASKLNGQSRKLVGWCNGTAATMKVEALPLLNASFTGTAPTGFDTRINYTATALANSVSANDSSISEGAGTPSTVGLFTGDVDVTLSASAAPTGGLLVAGGYAGQVLVTLSPSID